MKAKKLLVLILSLIMSMSLAVSASAATTPYVKSDTTVSFSRPQGQTYQVKLIVYGTHADPHIAAGDSNTLQTLNCQKTKDSSGNDVYYFKVKAVGAVGSSSAIYTTLPGQKAVNHFVMTVGKPVAASKSSSASTSSSSKITITRGAGTVGRGYTAYLSIKGKPNTDYTLTVYYPSGPSEAAGVGTTKTDSSGNASWAWKVGTRTTPGTHTIEISGDGQSITTSFKTT